MYYWFNESAMADNNTNNIRQLFLPPAWYLLYCKPIPGITQGSCHLGGAVQQPGNINTAYSGLCPFYSALLNEDIYNGEVGHTIYILAEDPYMSITWYWLAPLAMGHIIRNRWWHWKIQWNVYKCCMNGCQLYFWWWIGPKDKRQLLWMVRWWCYNTSINSTLTY